MTNLAAAPDIQGALELAGDGRLEGWCWSPAQPDAPLRVEILDGDTVLRNIEASRFRADLERMGIGDGRHGFSLELPALADPAPLVAGSLLRARAGGVVFGQILLDSPPGGQMRLDAAVDELARLHERLAGRPQAEPNLDLLAAMLALRPSRVRPGDPDYVVALAQTMLRRRHPPFALPTAPRRPGLGIVLVAAEPDATIAALRALVPALAGQDAALILADAGADPHTLLLPGLVSGLALAHQPSQAAAVNAAVAMLRADVIVVLHAGRPPSGVSLACLGQHLKTHPASLLTGDTVRDSLERWAMQPHAPLLNLPGVLDLLLATSATLWREAGGLDPDMEDGAGLDYADLALRLGLLGAAWHVVETPARQTTRAAAEPGLAWQAATRFRTRWGRRDP